MIKKQQKHAARKPQVAALTPVELARVTGADGGDGTKIKETLVGD